MIRILLILKISMETIEVKHSVWDIIQHKFNECKFQVIWYDFIQWRWIRYICLWANDNSWIYLYDIEIQSSNDSTIGFITKKD